MLANEQLLTVAATAADGPNARPISNLPNPEFSKVYSRNTNA